MDPFWIGFWVGVGTSALIIVCAICYGMMLESPDRPE